MQGLKHMFGYEVWATDGKIGKVEDFFVEEATWNVRYLVVRTGGALSGERALSPAGRIVSSDVQHRRVEIALSKAQAAAIAPSGELVCTVSAEMERILKSLYGGADYRRDNGLVRIGYDLPPASRPVSSLRSVKEITTYRIETLDGPCGLCTDLLADTDGWTVPYFVVNTKEWLPHGHVLVPTAWIQYISWQEMQTDVGVHRPRIQHAQRFDPASHDVWHGGAKPLHRSA